MRELASRRLLQKVQYVDHLLHLGKSAKRSAGAGMDQWFTSSQLGISRRSAVACDVTEAVTFTKYQASEFGFANAHRIFQSMA